MRLNIRTRLVKRTAARQAKAGQGLEGGEYEVEYPDAVGEEDCGAPGEGGQGLEGDGEGMVGGGGDGHARGYQ